MRGAKSIIRGFGTFDTSHVARLREKRGAFVGRWQEKIANEQQPTIIPEKQGFHPVESISLTEGMQDIITGRWRGIGLLDVLEGYTHIFGRQVLLVEPSKNRHRLREQYAGAMMFEPQEFLDVIESWPESEGIVRAKRAFAGNVISVAS